MHRREFLKKSCAACILIGSGVFIESLSACSVSSVYKTAASENKITIPKSLFADNELQIVRVPSMDYDIAVRKDSDNNFTALLMQCTHAENHLISNGSGFYCNLHGSKFNSAGSVIKGPAELPLKKLNTTIISESIIISI